MIPRETRITFEASGLAYSISKRLRDLDILMSFLHTERNRVDKKSKIKNNRVGSIKIAKLHLVNMIPKTYLISDEDRIVRDLIMQGLRLSQYIADTKNSITVYLKKEGLYSSLSESSDSFSEKRRSAIRPISISNLNDLVMSSIMDRQELYESQAVKPES
ncbi:MAG: hypothetical protein QXQ46_09010 [Thermoplasmatales archaeon]